MVARDGTLGGEKALSWQIESQVGVLGQSFGGFGSVCLRSGFFVRFGFSTCGFPSRVCRTVKQATEARGCRSKAHGGKVQCSWTVRLTVAVFGFFS